MRIMFIVVVFIFSGIVHANSDLPDINIGKASEALEGIQKGAFGNITLEYLKQLSKKGKTITVEKKFPSTTDGDMHTLIIMVNEHKSHILYIVEAIEPGRNYPHFDITTQQILNKVRSLGLKVKDAKYLSDHSWEWTYHGFKCKVGASTANYRTKSLMYECVSS